jgi:hypothetical protein
MLKGEIMKAIASFFSILLIFLVGICSAEITGVVVDAETGKPVEGAAVLVEWTITKGLPGLSHTESYQVYETNTDNNGKYTIPRIINPLVHSPNITIYKKGYVAWNNKLIYPDYKERGNFVLKDGSIYKLEKFKTTDNYRDHQAFVDDVIHVGLATEKKQNFLKICRE